MTQTKEHHIDREALLPCPFCGGPASCYQVGENRYYADCTEECLIDRKTRKEAVDYWNQRVTAEPATPVQGEIRAIVEEWVNTIGPNHCKYAQWDGEEYSILARLFHAFKASEHKRLSMAATPVQDTSTTCTGVDRIHDHAPIKDGRCTYCNAVQSVQAGSAQETPETDHLATRRAYAIGRADLAVCWKEMYDHARTLERQRNEARREAERRRQRLTQWAALLTGKDERIYELENQLVALQSAKDKVMIECKGFWNMCGCPNCCKADRKAADLLEELATQATSTAAQVPKDYVLVPRVPTQETVATIDELIERNAKRGWIPSSREIYSTMLSAAPPQGESSEGWMPIETAPKDGTEIIVFHPAAGVCAAFCPQEGFAWHCMDGQNRFINNLGVSIPRMTSFIEPPTLWQPLPPPPSQKKATQEGDA